MARETETEFIALTQRDLERLALTLDAASSVRKRSQLFLWLQGRVQSMVPHELLLFVHGDISRRALAFDHFSSYPLPEGDLAALFDSEAGLAVQAVRTWLERGERPLVIAHDVDEQLHHRFESLLFRFRLANLAVHGTPSYSGSPASYFIFARMPEPLVPGLVSALDLLMPQLHVVFLRVMSAERPDAAEFTRNDALITDRETEILRWVRDGKSNQEIGEILGISPLTVKNHVQKILKKLKVQNRAQAVGKALAMQIIKSSPG